MLLILNEIDKRITFHHVLGVEYMMKVGKYSNTEYVVKSWIMMVIAILGFIAAFANTSNIFSRLVVLCVWQSGPPLIIFMFVTSFKEFVFKRISNQLDYVLYFSGQVIGSALEHFQASSD